MPKCIITGESITQENDSKAHVIPSALGGRLKPFGIMCQKGNTLAGDKIDIDMIETFQPIMSLINGTRDKGRNRPINVQDESGAEYLFKFGEPLRPSSPSFRKEPTPTGARYEISARTMKEARTLLGRIRADYPTFDIDQAMANAIPVQQWPEGKIKIELQVGPRTTLPSIYVGASIVARMLGNIPHPDLKAFVARFNPEKPEMPQDTFYFIVPGLFRFVSPYAINHSIIAVGDPARSQMLIIIDLFGGFTFGSVVPLSLSEKVHFAHSVDVLTGLETAVDVDWDMLVE